MKYFQIEFIKLLGRNIFIIGEKLNKLKKETKVIYYSIKFLLIFTLFYIFIYKYTNIFYFFNNHFSYQLIEEDNKNKTWLKGIEYINKCLHGYIINRIPQFPTIFKISVVIPVFNSNNTIIYAIRSIQNQNFIDYELILVNDFSNDDSKKIIDSLAKNDSRIKIINNSKNKGTLYSRCVGVLLSKGKYIFSLDNDDMFFTNDLFNTIYQYQEKTKFDIIVFHSVFSQKYFPKIDDIVNGPYFHEHYLTVYQPELSRFIEKDLLVWTKSIKAIIYKKAINLMGIKRYSKYLSWAEDTSIMFIIFNIARSLRYFRKYGVFHIEAKFCVSFSDRVDEFIFGEIFLSNIIFEFSRKKDKNLVVRFILNIARFGKFGIHTKYLLTILNKILKSRYITSINKEEIKRKFKDIKMLHI